VGGAIETVINLSKFDWLWVRSQSFSYCRILIVSCRVTRALRTIISIWCYRPRHCMEVIQARYIPAWSVIRMSRLTGLEIGWTAALLTLQRTELNKLEPTLRLLCIVSSFFDKLGMRGLDEMWNVFVSVYIMKYRTLGAQLNTGNLVLWTSIRVCHFKHPISESLYFTWQNHYLKLKYHFRKLHFFYHWMSCSIKHRCNSCDRR